MESNRKNSFCVMELIGGIIALVFSWIVNGSVGWAILHLLCGWFYIVYALIFHYETIQTAISNWF